MQARSVTPDFAELFTYICTKIRRRALLIFLTNLDDPESVQLRYAESLGRPFWSTGFVLYGATGVIEAQWEHIRDRLGAIPGVQFNETTSYRFPLSDEQVEAVPAKARFGIPSLNLFGSRNAPGQQPNEGHLDFSPMILPLLVLSLIPDFLSATFTTSAA